LYTTAALRSINCCIAAISALKRFSSLVVSYRRTINPFYAPIASSCIASRVASSSISTSVALILIRGLLGRVAKPDTPVLGSTPVVEGLLVFFGAIACL
jgi:hypothetical protein